MKENPTFEQTEKIMKQTVGGQCHLWNKFELHFGWNTLECRIPQTFTLKVQRVSNTEIIGIFNEQVCYCLNK